MELCAFFWVVVATVAFDIVRAIIKKIYADEDNSGSEHDSAVEGRHVPSSEVTPNPVAQSWQYKSYRPDPFKQSGGGRKIIKTFNQSVEADAESICSLAGTKSCIFHRDIPEFKRWEEFYGWMEFKRKHVITTETYPNHVSWTENDWNDFAKERAISNDHINSVISVSVEIDIIQDFNPMDTEYMVNKETGPVYLSRHKRHIFHLIPKKLPGDSPFFVRMEEFYYLAITEYDGYYKMQLPYHFASRYNAKRTTQVQSIAEY